MHQQDAARRVQPHHPRREPIGELVPPARPAARRSAPAPSASAHERAKYWRCRRVKAGSPWPPARREPHGAAARRRRIVRIVQVVRHARQPAQARTKRLRSRPPRRSARPRPPPSAPAPSSASSARAPRRPAPLGSAGARWATPPRLPAALDAIADGAAQARRRRRHLAALGGLDARHAARHLFPPPAVPPPFRPPPGGPSRLRVDRRGRLADFDESERHERHLEQREGDPQLRVRLNLAAASALPGGRGRERGRAGRGARRAAAATAAATATAAAGVRIRTRALTRRRAVEAEGPRRRRPWRPSLSSPTPRPPVRRAAPLRRARACGAARPRPSRHAPQPPRVVARCINFWPEKNYFFSARFPPSRNARSAGARLLRVLASPPPPDFPEFRAPSARRAAFFFYPFLFLFPFFRPAVRSRTPPPPPAPPEAQVARAGRRAIAPNLRHRCAFVADAPRVRRAGARARMRVAIERGAVARFAALGGGRRRPRDPAPLPQRRDPSRTLPRAGCAARAPSRPFRPPNNQNPRCDDEGDAIHRDRCRVRSGSKPERGQPTWTSSTRMPWGAITAGEGHPARGPAGRATATTREGVCLCLCLLLCLSVSAMPSTDRSRTRRNGVRAFAAVAGSDRIEWLGGQAFLPAGGRRGRARLRHDSVRRSRARARNWVGGVVPTTQRVRVNTPHVRGKGLRPRDARTSCLRADGVPKGRRGGWCGWLPRADASRPARGRGGRGARGPEAPPNGRTCRCGRHTRGGAPRCGWVVVGGGGGCGLWAEEEPAASPARSCRRDRAQYSVQ